MNARAERPERVDAVLYSRAAVEPDSVSDESRSVDVIASTSDVDGHGTVVRQNWLLERFKSNPVVLYAHNSWDLPIGVAENVRVEGGQLRATLTFSTEDLNPEAERVWRNVKAKVIRGVSVGFYPHSVTSERQDDREIYVLDDNELYEISMTPVPSNPAALAQMRARALSAHPQQDPAPRSPNPPEKPEETPMTEPNQISPTVARALGLSPGSSESDQLAAATRVRELELQIIAITGVTSSAEALGAVRALKAEADKVKDLRAECNKLRGERDAQNFDALIQRGTSEGKLSAAEAKFEREKFDRKVAEGRGEEAVGELKGFLDVAQTRIAQRHVQPSGSAGGEASPLVYNGKTYRDMRPLERARMAQDPATAELYRAMKQDWEAAGRPAATSSSAA